MIKNLRPKTKHVKNGSNMSKKRVTFGKANPVKIEANEVKGKKNAYATSSNQSGNFQCDVDARSNSAVRVSGETTKKRKLNADAKFNTPNKKPKLHPLRKKDRKTLRKKKANKNFSLAKRLKVLWEEIRINKTEATKKASLLLQALAVIKGHIFELVFAHDTVRVIESLIKFGTTEQRTEIFEELKGSVILLAKSKYSKFFLLKMLQFGTKAQKQYILKQFFGKVVQLVCHVEASSVIEAAFNGYANASQREEMVQEFYGPCYKYFKDSDSSSLAEVLRRNPDKRISIIEHLQKILESAIMKSAHKHCIVHRALNEYMDNADDKHRSEMIEQLRNHVVEILHTKDGSKVAMKCLWHGTAKDRKVMMKSFKNHITKIAQEEFGHMVLLAIFDCVDDTKSVEKHIIKEISQNANTICQNLYGKKVLLYLVSPRNPAYFHPHIVQILKLGDSNAMSKKPQTIRRSELHSASAPMLLKFITDNLHDVWTDLPFCLFTASVLKNIKVDCKDAFICIAELAAKEKYFSYSSEMDSRHFIEEISSNILMRNLIKSDKERMLQKHVTFSEVLIQKIPDGRLSTWIHCNRGCFLLVMLLETNIENVVNRVTKEIKMNENLINSKEYQGAHILLRMINSESA